MSSETTDAEFCWVAVDGDGDGASFAAVFDQHQQHVFRHSLPLVPTFDDAKDVPR